MAPPLSDRNPGAIDGQFELTGKEIPEVNIHFLHARAVGHNERARESSRVHYREKFNRRPRLVARRPGTDRQLPVQTCRPSFAANTSMHPPRGAIGSTAISPRPKPSSGTAIASDESASFGSALSARLTINRRQRRQVFAHQHFRIRKGQLKFSFSRNVRPGSNRGSGNAALPLRGQKQRTQIPQFRFLFQKQVGLVSIGHFDGGANRRRRR